MTEKKSPDDPLKANFYRRRDAWIDHVLTVNDLSPMARVVGVWIARRINYRKGHMWYKIETMAKKFEVTPRTIIRAVKELEGYRADKKTGEVTQTGEQLLLVKRDSQRGKNTAVNKYEIIAPWDMVTELSSPQGDKNVRLIPKGHNTQRLYSDGYIEH
ncbi:helix-turn-helix domain-containing protein [Nitratireductor basaltis]|uniref:Uncharacterized protein n=1 Tax=Nitratireductor basaltis TaxID=472175 RepID=A0A084UDM9_9HYPH|nr:helix-turn-helix domain-containing protein [Nitratireductor basaltis]KFB11065.1 hypothetical protein EL18_02107 [Nitratireductor basaltis]